MMHMLPERLRKLRKKYNMTQAELAERLGVSASTVSSYERDTTDPSVAVIIKLSVIFDVQCDYVLGLNNHNFVCVDGLSSKNVALIQDMVNSMKKTEPH